MVGLPLGLTEIVSLDDPGDGATVASSRFLPPLLLTVAYRAEVKEIVEGWETSKCSTTR